MGNSRFKLSDMIPKTWFYKLKHMTTTTKHSNNKTNTHSQSSSAPNNMCTYVYDPRHSHFSLSFSDDLPRRSSNKRSRSRVSAGRKAIYRPSPSPSPLLATISNSDTCSPHPPAALSSCNCRLSSSTKDIIIDMSNVHNLGAHQQQEEEDTISDTVELPTQFSRSSITPTGIRLRPNSPRIASKKIQALARKSTSTRYGNGRHSMSMISNSTSLAVVKSSCDPQRDFRESMVEMIEQNNIRTPRDFEDLLACYLTLNSDENHHLIVSAFQQIWFHFHDMLNS